MRGDYGLILYPKPVHAKKAGRHLALGLTLLLTIVYRRMADALAKQRAERAETLKTYFKANVGDRHPPVSKQLFGLFDSPVDQVLVWGGRKLFTKAAQKMVTGQACLLGNLIQIEWPLIVFVDKGTRAPKPLVNLASRLGFCLSHWWANLTATR
jgi:hypothetical protein